MSNTSEPEYKRLYHKERNHRLGAYIMYWLWRNGADVAFLDSTPLKKYLFQEVKLKGTYPFSWLKEDVKLWLSATELNYNDSSICDLYLSREKLDHNPGRPEKLADSGRKVLVFEIPDDDKVCVVVNGLFGGDVEMSSLPTMDLPIELRNEDLRKRWMKGPAPSVVTSMT